jgi:hypothetical protein
MYPRVIYPNFQLSIVFGPSQVLKVIIWMILLAKTHQWERTSSTHQHSIQGYIRVPFHALWFGQRICQQVWLTSAWQDFRVVIINRTISVYTACKLSQKKYYRHDALDSPISALFFQRKKYNRIAPFPWTWTNGTTEFTRDMNLH